MARVLGTALGPVLGFGNWALSPLHPAPRPPVLPVKGQLSLTSPLHSHLICVLGLRSPLHRILHDRSRPPILH